MRNVVEQIDEEGLDGVVESITGQEFQETASRLLQALKDRKKK